MADTEMIDLGTIWPGWRLGESLGGGSYGDVYEAIHEEQGTVIRAAVKVISIPQRRQELDEMVREGVSAENSRTYYREIVNDFVNEIKVMISLKNAPNIVSIEDYHVENKPDGVGADIYIRMELLTPLSVYLMNRNPDTLEVAKIGSDICSALETCMGEGVIHRDVKPENIMVDKFGQFKLGDFGVSKRLSSMQSSYSVKGTPNYMAPEVYYGKNYDSRADIYSLGLVLYYLSNRRRLPFLDLSAKLLSNREKEDAVFRRLRGQQFDPPVDASDELAFVIMTACNPDPNGRFQAAGEMKRYLDLIAKGVPLDCQNRENRDSGDLSGDSHEADLDPNDTIIVRRADQENGRRTVRDGFNGETNDRTDDDGEKRRRLLKLIRVLGIACSAIVILLAATLILPELIDENEGDQKQDAVVYSAFAAAQNTKYDRFGLDSVTGLQTVGFGHFEQDNDPDNGEEGITWLVLDETDEYMLLISRLCLDNMSFMDDSSQYTGNRDWERSSLREWLNTDFLETAFTSEEKKLLLTGRGISGTEKDLVSVLSMEEAYYYFDSDNERRAENTEYAEAVMKKNMISSAYYPNTEQEVDERTEGWYKEYGGRCAWWWVMNDPGGCMVDALGNGYAGTPGGGVSAYNREEADNLNSVRPVILIRK